MAVLDSIEKVSQAAAAGADSATTSTTSGAASVARNWQESSAPSSLEAPAEGSVDVYDEEAPDVAERRNQLAASLKDLEVKMWDASPQHRPAVRALTRALGLLALAAGAYFALQYATARAGRPIPRPCALAATVLQRISSAVAGARPGAPISAPSHPSAAASAAAAPSLNAAEAEAVIRSWMRAKSRALGPAHEVNELNSVLGGGVLPQWRQLAQQVQQQGCHWQYRLRSLKLGHVSAGAASGTASLQAELDEEGKLMAGADKVHGYSKKYTMRYGLQQAAAGGAWKIVTAEMLEDA